MTAGLRQESNPPPQDAAQRTPQTPQQPQLNHQAGLIPQEPEHKPQNAPTAVPALVTPNEPFPATPSPYPTPDANQPTHEQGQQNPIAPQQDQTTAHTDNHQHAAHPQTQPDHQQQQGHTGGMLAEPTAQAQPDQHTPAAGLQLAADPAAKNSYQDEGLRLQADGGLLVEEKMDGEAKQPPDHQVSSELLA